MFANYKDCERRLLIHEGGKYTDGVHPYDPGGPTRWGITLEDARLHWKHNATAEDVRTMPIEVAMEIYKHKYWDACSCDDLPSGVDYVVFDYGVNSGIGRAGKVLRRLCGLSDKTSKIDLTVLAAVARRDPKQLIQAIDDERLQFLQSLKIWPTYKNGWTTRVHEVNATALALAEHPTVAPTTPVTAPIADIPAAKGVVDPPTISPAAIKGSATVAAAGGLGFSAWFQAHPAAIILAAAALLGLVILVIRLIERNRASRQEAPTAGLVPVPEIAQ